MTLEGPVAGVSDAIVREVANLPTELPGASVIGPHTYALPGALLFGIPRVAQYLIRSGMTIDVAIVPGGDRASARLFLHDSARGTLIHQRGELPLNAAAMASPDGAGVAICGPSGVGKSTLGFTLSRRGWRLVADEVTRVSWNGSAPVAWPSDSSLKLWRHACEGGGVFSDKLERVRPGLERYYVPVSSAPAPVPLRVIVMLRIAPGRACIRVAKSAKATFLAESTFRPRQIEPLGQRAAFDKMVAHLSVNCRMFILDGAKEAPIEDLANRLEATLR